MKMMNSRFSVHHWENNHGEFGRKRENLGEFGRIWENDFIAREKA